MVHAQQGRKLRELALFAGGGGGILGGVLLGWKCVCAVEIDDYARRILLSRQRDRMLGRFPIWDDVTTFCGHEWRGRVDVISGGFPCQDISSANSASKRKGLRGEKSGLWRDFARIIQEVQPPSVFIENSPLLRTNGLDQVLSDLASIGFDARWTVLGGLAVGSPQYRERIWIRATNRTCDGLETRASPVAETAGRKNTPDIDNVCKSELAMHAEESVMPNICESSTENRWWPDSVIPRVADGLAHRVDRIKATGNGQIPAVAALAWEILA